MAIFTGLQCRTDIKFSAQVLVPDAAGNDCETEGWFYIWTYIQPNVHTDEMDGWGMKRVKLSYS